MTRTHQTPFSKTTSAASQNNPLLSARAPHSLVPASNPLTSRTRRRDITRRKRKSRSERTKKTNFEQRFLSERYRGGAGMLEVAEMWRGNVVSIDSWRDATKTVSVGRSEDASYRVEAAALGDAEPLVEHDGAHWTLHVREWMDGFVVAVANDGKSRKLSFDDAVAANIATRTVDGWSIRIDGRTRARVDAAEQTFLVHFVTAPSLELPLFAKIGAGLAVALVLSFVAHLFFGGLVAFSTDRVDELELDRMANASRYGDALVQPMAQEEEVAPEPEKVDEAHDEDTVEDPAAGQVDGGKTVEGIASSEGGGPNRGDGSPNATDDIINTGTLVALNSLARGPGADMYRGDFEDMTTFRPGHARIPGIYGDGQATSGRIGGRESGDGPDWGNGHRKGDPDGDGETIGRPETALTDPKKKIHKPTMVPQRPDISGSLTQREIRKVINDHKREIRAAYEKALMKKKGLNGKITVQFIIDASGNVASATVISSTMNAPQLERTIVNALKHWRFPTPKGGGLVKVTYPFVLEVK